MASGVVSLGLICLSLSIAVSQSDSVTVYLNSCLDDMHLKDYNNYTGLIETFPAKDVAKGSSIELAEYAYAKEPWFGSVLMGNINYYQEGEDDNVLFHWFVNVNATGDVQSSIQPPHGANPLSGVSCIDVPSDTGKLPSVIGVWVFYSKNQTYEGCKDSIPSNSNLVNCAYNVSRT